MPTTLLGPQATKQFGDRCISVPTTLLGPQATKQFGDIISGKEREKNDLWFS